MHVISNNTDSLLSVDEYVQSHTKYKLSFTIDDMYHFRLRVINDTTSYDITQNIYSDAGTYKIMLFSPISGDLYIYKSPDRNNSWERMTNVQLARIH